MCMTVKCIFYASFHKASRMIIISTSWYTGTDWPRYTFVALRLKNWKQSGQTDRHSTSWSASLRSYTQQIFMYLFIL